MRKKTAKKPVAAKVTAPQTNAAKEETAEAALAEKEEAVEAAENETTAEEKAAEVAVPAEEKVKTAVKKTTAKKAAEKKDEMKPEVYIQFAGQEAVLAEVIEKAKKQFVEEGHRAGTIKSLQVYLKPEEYAAYYVINQKHAGRVDLF